jgi:ubiquinol-cytochrome c reductase iron-sulfur subunit
VWIINRTKKCSTASRKAIPVSDPNSNVPQQPPYAKNEFRSIKPDIAVLEGVCTHLGCSPHKSVDAKGDMGQDWNGGFLSLSRFQIRFCRARIRLPAGAYQSRSAEAYRRRRQIIIGDDTKGA